MVPLMRSSYRREVIKTYVSPSTILLMFTHLSSTLDCLAIALPITLYPYASYLLTPYPTVDH